VDGLSFTLERGKTLGIVGESGSGKSVTSLGILGLHRRGRHGVGEVWLDGEELDRGVARARAAPARPEDGDDLPGPADRDAPVLHRRRQIIEALRVHHKVSQGEARKRAIEMPRPGRHPAAGNAGRRLPHQFSGGHAAARDDRDGAGQQPGAADRDEPTHRAGRHRARRRSST
jgi:peptide/nickel transport system ATP-binding protein